MVDRDDVLRSLIPVGVSALASVLFRVGTGKSRRCRRAGSHRGSPRYERMYAGTAVAGEDYQATAGTLTFAPGETNKAITVAVSTDSIPEPTETFYAALNSASANARIVGNGVPGEIYDMPDPIWVDPFGP